MLVALHFLSESASGGPARLNPNMTWCTGEHVKEAADLELSYLFKDAVNIKSIHLILT